MSALIFDIETVPDVELLHKEFGFKGSAIEICKQAEEHFLARSGTTFAPIIYHKIISIAGVWCDDYGYYKRVGNFAKQSNIAQFGDDLEKSLILQFLNTLESAPTLVSFNGRNFDLPCIMLRAMKYNINAKAYLEQDNKRTNKSKWENYRVRNSEKFHTDLLDILSGYGASRGMRLDSLCTAFDLPGKFDVSGDQVFSLYYGENGCFSDFSIDEVATINYDQTSTALNIIDDYCQSDVLNTYMLYLKYLILRGDMDKVGYLDVLQVFLENLPKDKNYSSVFATAIEGQIKMTKDNLESIELK